MKAWCDRTGQVPHRPKPMQQSGTMMTAEAQPVVCCRTARLPYEQQLDCNEVTANAVVTQHHTCNTPQDMNSIERLNFESVNTTMWHSTTALMPQRKAPGYIPLLILLVLQQSGGLWGQQGVAVVAPCRVTARVASPVWAPSRAHLHIVHKLKAPNRPAD